MFFFPFAALFLCFPESRVINNMGGMCLLLHGYRKGARAP